MHRLLSPVLECQRRVHSRFLPEEKVESLHNSFVYSKSRFRFRPQMKVN